MFEARQDVSLLQQEDLVMFGRLILGLCCNNTGAVNNIQKSLETVGRHFSAEVKNIIMYLLSKPMPVKVHFLCLSRYFPLISLRISANCSR